MRFWCWLNGHRPNLMNGMCRRCHAVAVPWAALSLDPLLDAVTRLLNSYSAILERPEQKPSMEVVDTIPEEIRALLDMARTNPLLRSRLPKHWQDTLNEEEAEMAEMENE